jgi:hypothetical protein
MLYPLNAELSIPITGKPLIESGTVTERLEPANRVYLFMEIAPILVTTVYGHILDELPPNVEVQPLDPGM